MARNSHFPLLDISIIGAGPETEMEFYENAACVIGAVVSGSAGVESPGGAKNAIIDHLSPLIAKWTAEVAHAVPGMKRDEANEIVKRLLLKYESNIDNPPQGKRYQDCFNIKTREPGKKYSALYEKAKEELTGYGLKFK